MVAVESRNHNASFLEFRKLYGEIDTELLHNPERRKGAIMVQSMFSLQTLHTINQWIFTQPTQKPDISPSLWYPISTSAKELPTSSASAAS
jgi:hypothetical protein